MLALGPNVISEALEPMPDDVVIALLHRPPADLLHLSGATLAERLSGIGSVLNGRLEHPPDHQPTGSMELFDDRVLRSDIDAAHGLARTGMPAEAGQRGLPKPDAFLAATAAARGVVVASRDAAPFVAAEAAPTDPWQA